MLKNKKKNKKSIMYIKGNDYYYISYNIILFLYGLKCFYPKRYLVDYRKLQFVSDFVSDPRYLKIVDKDSNCINVRDKQLLSRLYSSGITNKSQILQVLYLLENKGIVDIRRSETKKTFDVSLKVEGIDKSFFSRDIFMNELNNIHEFKSLFRGLSNIKYETMLNKMFSENGIAVWHI